MSSELCPEQLQQLYLSSLIMGRKRQQPLLTVQAHIFHINQETKKTWLPVTEAAIPVSFYYDVNRGMYRIISVDGTQAVVNSGVCANMTFSRTSHKFGQWTDTNSNATYGLGFVTEDDARKFHDQFEDIKEALRLSISSPSKSSQTSKLAGMMSSILKPESDAAPGTTDLNANSVYQMRRPLVQGCSSGSPCKTRIESPRRLPLPHQFMESKHEEDGRNHTPDSQLKFDNEKLRIALQQSSVNAKKWEMERATLKSENASLTQKLREYSFNVDEWKAQLSHYKEENQKLRQQISEAENACGDKNANGDLLQQIESLRTKADFNVQELTRKDDEIYQLKENLAKNAFPKENVVMLQKALQMVKGQLDHTLASECNHKEVLHILTSELGEKLDDLVGIHQKISTTLK